MQKMVWLMGVLLSHFAYPAGLSLTHHAFTDKEKSEIREWFLDTWEQNKDQPHSEEWTLNTLRTVYEEEKAALHPLTTSINMNQSQDLALDILTGQGLKSFSHLQMRALFLTFLIRQLGLSSKGKIIIKKLKIKIESPRRLRQAKSLKLRKFLKENLFRQGQFEVHKNLMYAFNRFFQAYEMEINHISQVVHSHSYSYHEVDDRIQTIRKHLLKSKSRWTLFASSLSAGMSGPAWFKSCQEVFFP